MPLTVYHKISELIIKKLRGELTSAEVIELDQWIQSSPENKTLYEELTTEETLAKEVKDMEGIKARIRQKIYGEVPQLTPVIPMYRRPVFKWVAAACIVLAVGVLANVWWNKKTTEQPPIAKTQDVPAPSNSRAVITLANGQKVYLDSASNGTIAQENNVSIVKNAEGGISYLSPAGGGGLNDSPNNKRPVVDYNTLFNPRGSKVISLALSDGSHVWLNAGSSIKYPVAFISKERQVEITGEAYFEVVHNSKQPFKVLLPNGSIVEDIGTSFNINAYPDEQAIKTTLIEGSVKVTGPKSQATLKPGQQAAINTFNLQLLTFNSVDLEETVAWKNGKFDFNSADIQTIMRQISRWYDVDVVYEGNIPQREFTGKINRNVNASQVLKILELSKIHFRIEGKKIVVMQ